MEVLLELVPPDLAEYVGNGGARVGTADAAQCIGAALRAAPGFARAVAELTDPAAGPAPFQLSATSAAVTAVAHSCGGTQLCFSKNRSLKLELNDIL